MRRVLKPGGMFGIYDQMREADGELTFPVPWATVSETSFVETPDRYQHLLMEAGFEVIWTAVVAKTHWHHLTSRRRRNRVPARCLLSACT